MRKWIFKSIGLHLAIALIYLGLTSYEFVILNEANPIGIGIQQWLLIFAHFGITAFVWAFIIKASTDKRLARKKFGIQTLIIFLIVVLNLSLGDPIWTWLWSLRGDVIQ